MPLLFRCLAVALAITPLASAQALLPSDPSDASESAAAAHPVESVVRPINRPFRSIAVVAKIGSGGAGFDLATPLSSRLSLRAGAQFFDDTLEIKANGIQADGDITLQNVAASLDYYPFRGSFRISPGITIHNDNHVAGPIFVPGGNSFSLGDIDYTSDPNDPIRGFARARFGSTVAPRLTVGFGNLFPRSGRRFSVPVEFGFQYSSAPTLDFALTGSGCTAQGCGPINDGTGAQDIANERKMLQDDLTALRFFPILSIGFAYKFGH